MTTANFRALSPFSDQRETSEVVNNILAGKLNATASITITNSATSTVVTDYRVGSESVILFMPTTSAGATELASGSMYVSARSKNSFTITHTNDTTTRSFDYVVIG
jgi:hypothetical protein